MKAAHFVFLGALFIAGCGRQQGAPAVNPGPANKVAPAAQGSAKKEESLVAARQGFKTKVVRKDPPGAPLPEPPAKLFRKTKFDAPIGKLSAYLTPDPKDGKKHPAIIWITGGDCNSVDDSIWQNAPPSNDQTASAFRKAGIIMMFPTLRGGNDNPGVREGFLGEVDDILAAADYLAKQDYVDPKRIYLGGHSTGGTMVLLTAECSDRFRAVFSFGPAADVRGYGPEFTYWDTANNRENELRSPVYWLGSIKGKVFVFEGEVQGNIQALEALKAAAKVYSADGRIQFYPVRGATHFSLLAPTTRLIAQKILSDDGAVCNIAFTQEEVNRVIGK